MKKTYLFAGLVAGASALGGSSAQAQFTYTPGDVVIYRVGDGTAALTNAGTAVFLDEYTPAGTLAGSYELPTTAGTALPLVASGTAGSEGQLSTTANGADLLVTGYDAAVGTAAIASSTSAADPREVDTVSSTGSLVSTTINNYSGNNIRSAASTDGTTIYTSGANTGILQVSSGAVNSTGTVVSASITGGTALTNTRALSISNGTLYLSTGSGTSRIDSLGSATSPAGPAAPLAGISSTNISGPYQFVVTSLGGSTSDTLYVADNSAGTIEKFSLTSGSFTLTGTAALPGVVGLIGTTVAGVETLFATTETTTGETVVPGLYTLTDASGAGGTLTASATELAGVGTNEAFRGLAFAPTLAGVPEPSTWVMLGLGGLGLVTLVLRRRTDPSCV